MNDFECQHWNLLSCLRRWNFPGNFVTSFEMKMDEIISAKEEFNIFIQNQNVNSNSEVAINFKSLHALLHLQAILTSVQFKRMKLEEIDFLSFKVALIDAYQYGTTTSSDHIFIAIVHQFFELFLSEYLIKCSAVCLILMEKKIQELLKICDESMSTQRWDANFDPIEELAILHCAYLEHLQVTWDVQKVHDLDSNANLLDILEYLQLPVLFPWFMIQTVEEADICFNLTMEKIHCTMNFIEKYKANLENDENHMESKISLLSLLFIARFTNAFSSCKYAEFRKSPQNALELYNSSLNILEGLKTTCCLDLNVKLFIKTMAQITFTLNKLVDLFKGMENVQLQEYSLKFIAHYEEFEKFISQYETDIKNDDNLLIICKDNYQVVETFYKEVIKDEAMAKYIAKQYSSHFTTVEDLASMVEGISWN